MTTNLKEKILIAAVRIAAKKGYKQISRREAANAAKVSLASVSYHFESMGGLYDAILQRAIDSENLPIILQAISARDPILLRPTHAALRIRALNSAL